MRALQELRYLASRRRWREIHFSYSTVDRQDRLELLRDTVALLLGRGTSDGSQVSSLESALVDLLGVHDVVSFGSGRAALAAILRALDIGPGDEVVLPAFTCVVVPFAVRHVGAVPVYVDIDFDYRMNLQSLTRALGDRTKLIIAQHTYGLPERMEHILSIASTAGVRVIEDCAHTLGGSLNGRVLGSFGEASFFSFEVTKPITSGWGGAAATSNPELARRLRTEARLPVPDHSGSLRIALQLTVASFLYHPDAFAVGRILLAILYRLGILSISIPESQRQGRPPEHYRQLSDAQAALLLRQLRRLPTITQRRLQAAALFTEEFGSVADPDTLLLRYPLLTADRDQAVERCRASQIELGQWFQAPVHPSTSNIAYAGYTWGSCPVAESLSSRCVNLPTLLSDSDLSQLLAWLREHMQLEVSRPRVKPHPSYA